MQMFDVVLWGLTAFWAEEAAHIMEYEVSGDSCFHDHFHAIGGGGPTAYAIYRTLGGRRLSELEESKALLVILRILVTCIDVEVSGVSEPLSAWIVSQGKARKVSEEEINEQLQFISEWQEKERRVLFDN